MRSDGLVVARAGPNRPMPSWELMWEVLTDKDLKSVSPQAAKKMLESGKYVLVDVQTKEDYEESHASGAFSAPLFQSVDWGNINPLGVLRAAALAVNGVKPVEPNPDFEANVRTASEDGKKGVILYCEAGGTMIPSTNFMRGKSSRSLKAAWKIFDRKIVGEVVHLAGGLLSWYQAGLPIKGEYDASGAGRTPNAAEAPTGDFITEDKAREK